MLGCAVLAAVAAGAFPDVPAACAAMVAVERVVEPNPAAAALYRGPYERYRALYPALAPLFHAHSSSSPAPAAADSSSADASPATAAPVATGATDSKLPTATPQAAGAAPGPPAPASGRGIIISPSILASDFARLADEVAGVQAAGCAWVHVDMFDSTYCPNFTVGPPVVASLRRHTSLVLDCHLAVQVRATGRAGEARGARRGGGVVAMGVWAAEGEAYKWW